MRSVRQLVIALIVSGIVAVLLFSLAYDRALAKELVAADLCRKLSKRLSARRPASGSAAVQLELRAPGPLQQVVRRTLGRGALSIVDRAADARIAVVLSTEQRSLLLNYRYTEGDSKAQGQLRGLIPTPWSAMPPLVAIIVALVTRRVIGAILAGILFGSALYLVSTAEVGSGWLLVPVHALWRSAGHYLFNVATNPFTLYMLGFTFLLCGMVGVTGRAGGNAGIVTLFSGLAKNRSRTCLSTALMGLVIFFEDYANAIVVGHTARPLTDAQRISREKLAYLVDATAAPVAGLALVSSWIGWEVGLLQGVTEELGLPLRGYQLLLSALPFRFYCLMSLVMVFSSVLLSRDFGPMLRAERRALRHGQLVAPGARPMTAARSELFDVAPGVGPSWWVTGVPIVLLLISVLAGMVWDGAQHVAPEKMGPLSGWDFVREAFVHADNGPVLFASSALAALVAALLAFGRLKASADSSTRKDPFKQLAFAFAAGGWASAHALAILIAAKALQRVCGDLSTSAYLVSLGAGSVPVWLLALMTFLIAAGVSFATGTSWGTMGILIPSVGPLAYHLGGRRIMTVALSSVLDGSIFGDHCSPISDTTIMSSLSCHCDHVDHVRTQAPYALYTMVVAATAGYLGVSLGLSVWLALSLAALLIVSGVRLVGRNAEQ